MTTRRKGSESHQNSNIEDSSILSKNFLNHKINMRSNKNGWENLIKSHEKAFFTLEEAAVLVESCLGDQYDLSYCNCGSLHRSSIGEIFYEMNFIHSDINSEKIKIKRPNHYVVISPCDCEYYITHAGILLLLNNAEMFLIKDEEKECKQKKVELFAKLN